jgi:uncharacterized protein YbaP (TraB family)
MKMQRREEQKKNNGRLSGLSATSVSITKKVGVFWDLKYKEGPLFLFGTLHSHISLLIEYVESKEEEKRSVFS